MIFTQVQNTQLCNQLFILAHYIANSAEYNTKYFYIEYKKINIYFKNVKFDKIYINNFYILKNNFSINLYKGLYFLLKPLNYLSNNNIIILFYKLYYINAVKQINLSANNILEISKSNNILLNGWLIRDNKSFNKHSNLIKKIFSFDEVTNKKASNLINHLRKENNELIIGLHIRRGDYINFEGGKYYYDNKSYIDISEKLIRLFMGINKKVAFVICSNEKQLGFGNDFHSHHYAKYNNSEIEDLCMLSLCDYIVGPPSTFSGWASFIGNVPLYHIYNIYSDIKISDFSVYKG